jgi:methionyl-tRNA synthetase
LNEFLSQTQPWALVKSTDPAHKGAAETILFLVAEGLRISGILLQPFLPDKASQLLDILGVAPENRTYAHTVVRCDPTYGVPRADPGQFRHDGLFPPLVEDVELEFRGSAKARKRATTKEAVVQTED